LVEGADLTKQPTSSEARERVLDAAAKLFTERGYAAVTLRDIAAEVGIRHTSLYHHVPGGKEELFVEVTERHLQQHRRGLVASMAAGGLDIRAQLYGAAEWFLTEPPVDLVRMAYADMPAIAPKEAERLSEMAFQALLTPVEEVLVAARARGEIDYDDLGLIAGGLVGMIQSLHSVPNYAFAEPGVRHQSRQEMAQKLIDVILRGLQVN
jgi:AcrR family transcriptional regulator